MRDLAGKVSILTGASRGIGPFIARALAKHGVRQVVAARSMGPLEALARELRDGENEAVPARADITIPADRAGLVETCIAELGPPDILINNAGIESWAPYHLSEPEEIERVINVNLSATMLLTREVLPHMVERGVGHIVNVSSLAGKGGIACNASYSASKFGLMGFTQSLRIEYYGTGVSASVVCPGFISDAGMWADAQNQTGVPAPGMFGTSKPEKVAEGVVRAIRRNKPELLINSRPVRPLLVIGALFPWVAEWVLRKTTKDVLRNVAERRTLQKATEPGQRALPEQTTNSRD